MMQQFTPRNFQFHSPDGRVIDTKEELWVWQAEYADLTCLRQFDLKTGLFHQMREIQTLKLKLLYISSSYYTGSHTVIFPTDEPFELIIRHERTRLHIGTPEDTGWFTYFVFGWIGKQSNKRKFLVLRQDEAIWTDDYRKVIR